MFAQSILRRSWFGSQNSSSKRSRQSAKLPRNPASRSFETLEERACFSGVPVLNSLPDSSKTLYLDFTGHFEGDWGQLDGVLGDDWHQGVSTPMFSLDNDGNFNSTEIEWMTEIWQRVAEDFAPFDINVSTVDPGSFDDHQAIRISIGGHWQDWYGYKIGGIALINSFKSSELSNTAFVFSDVFDSAKTIADAVSHEAGHTFGLEHHHLIVDGQIDKEYHPGTPEWGPLMGAPYQSERTTWSISPVEDGQAPGQGDLQILANGAGLGYVDDDFGNDISEALLISDPENTTIAGLLSPFQENFSPLADVDFFEVNLTGFSINSALVTAGWTIDLNVAEIGANLDAKLNIYDENGNLLHTIDPDNELGASIFIASGHYFIEVASHGQYGDIGRFSLSFNYTVDKLTFNVELEHQPLIDIICDPLGPYARVNDWNQLFEQLGQRGLEVLSVKSTGGLAALNVLKGSSPTLQSREFDLVSLADDKAAHDTLFAGEFSPDGLGAQTGVVKLGATKKAMLR